MTPDDARKLLGGYATGSLSESERKTLFDAALDDQELFDELAGEQALKEVLDEPGARQRLILALEPPKQRAWLWAWAGAAATLAIVIGVVVFQRTPSPPPQEIAQVMKSTESVAAPEAAPEAVPAFAPPPPRRKVASSPAAEPPPPPEPPAKALQEEALADRVQEVRSRTPAPQAAAGALRQFAAAVAPATFAFNYSVGVDGFLQIVPAAPGFLSVTANDMVIFPSAAVPAGMPVRIQIPPAAASVVIGFSRTPGVTGTPVRRDASTGREADQDPPDGKIFIQLFLTPATQ